MSTIINNQLIKKIGKNILIIIASLFGFMLFSLLMQMIFNLGNHFGVLLRVVYNVICH